MRKQTAPSNVLCSGLCLIGLLLAGGFTRAADAAATTQSGEDAGRPRTERRIESGWRFHAGDVATPMPMGQGDSYDSTKAGRARGAAAVDFDDTGWPTVGLPHDWSIATPITREANLSQGFHPRGVAWYRRAVRLAPPSRGKHLELQFDGVATYCTVWVNGILAARNFCGYTAFAIDITPFANYGKNTNQIAVRVDADPLEGWWYEGAGIYRHVRLVERNAVHIATDGVYANPVRDERHGQWTVPVEVTLGSSAKSQQDTRVAVTLVDPAGRDVATAQADATIAPFDTAVAKLSIPVQSPELWSVDKPTLYRVRTRLIDSATGDVLDQTEQSCGFRTLRFDKDLGFFLNDQPLKIKGTCNHQDAAGVGVAVPDSLWEWRLRRLKEMGSNAYRCAHNPPAKEFLDAADRIGMLVMDENRNFNTTDEYTRQLQWMIRRDRNHPSVFLWSVFNEEPMQGSEAGYEMVRQMSAVVKALDRTRPVTAAMSGGMMNDISVAQACDVVGFNYQHRNYDAFRKKFPNIPMISSEDTSAVQTRGEYVTDKKTRFIIDAYDDQAQPWGLTHRKAWEMIDTRPFLAGGFAWTGFDYRGEPQPLEWPATGSSFGIMDQCGFPKTAYYLHQAMWIKDRPILHIAPHWNWPGMDGQNIKVMVATNAVEAELSLNGAIAGSQEGRSVSDGRLAGAVRAWHADRDGIRRVGQTDGPGPGRDDRRRGRVEACPGSAVDGRRRRRLAADQRRGDRLQGTRRADGQAAGRVQGRRRRNDPRRRERRPALS